MKNDETGWLIEIADGRPPMWWAASPDPRALGGFDPDSLKATRFAREKDAKDMATFLHVKGAIAFADISNIRITEHAWSDNPTGLCEQLCAEINRAYAKRTADSGEVNG